MTDIEKLSSEKKLSVIMFTDIAGYSRMMNRNEDLAFKMLGEHNEIIKSLIKENRGVIIKTIGDSFLAKFESTSDCLNCAINIQKQFDERNKDKKKNETILVKIGIHIGDVVIVDNDVFGDAVNITSRIESKASGGEILISDAVFNILNKSSSFKFYFLGEFKLKNIGNPVRIHEALWHETHRWPKLIFKRRWFRVTSSVTAIFILLGIVLFLLYRDLAREKPKSGLYENRMSLAVMGFQDATNDKFFKEIGIESILTDAIGQKFYEFNEIHLVSPISIAALIKKKNLTRPKIVADLALAEEIARDVKANLMLAGRLNKIDNIYLLTSSLHSMDQNRLVGKFEIKFRNSREILTRVVDQLFKQLSKTLVRKYNLKSGDEIIPISSLTTSSLEAYSKFIKGYNLSRSGVFHPGIDMMIEATKIDPDFAMAYSMISCNYFDAEDHKNGKAYADMSRKFNKRFAKSISKEALIFKGNQAWYDYKLWEVKHNYSLIMELYPDDPEGYAYYAGYLKHLLKSPKKSIRYYKKAIELKPDYFPYYRYLALAEYSVSSVDRAVKILQQFIQENPGNPSIEHARKEIVKLREKR